MIGVFLRPDCTQVIVGEKKKKRLHVTDYKVIKQNYLKALKLDAISAVEAWRYFFLDVQSVTGRENDEIFIVLPDYVFSLLDCFYSSSHDQTRDTVAQRLQQSINNYYYSVPIITSPEPQKPMETVSVIERQIVDILAEAADQARVHLVSIEAASVAFLRSRCEYNQEQLILFSFDSKATLVGFSHNGGIFKMDNDDMSAHELSLLTAEEADMAIREAMSAFELSAEKTFEYLNQDLPYVVIGSSLAEKYEIIHQRAAQKIAVNDRLISGKLPYDNEYGWYCAMGTLLQWADFGADALEECIESYVQVLPGNVLPEEVQNKSKKFYRLERFFSFSRIAMILMGIISFAELAVILLFSATQIPEGLQEDYASGQESIANIERELSIIGVEQKEDQQILEAYSAVMSVKPPEIGYVSFEAGSDTKPNAAEWVKIKMLAADPLKFQAYINDLSGLGMFNSVAIPQMTTDNASGAKVANLVLGRKGEAK